ncbi:hypothetical protein Gotur_024834, partial [Gossypium turneri]
MTRASACRDALKSFIEGYQEDISFVIMYLEVVPGCLVLESGTSSGSNGRCVYIPLISINRGLSQLG